MQLILTGADKLFSLAFRRNIALAAAIASTMNVEVIKLNINIKKCFEFQFIQ